MDKQQREYIHHLMLQYSDAMVRLTYRRVGDWHLAEDLVQETFLTACCKSERVCGHKKPVAWLFETLNNLTLRESRRFYHTEVSIQDIAESHELTELPMTCHIPMGLYCGLQVNTKYTKEAGSLCHGRGFLLVNFMTALSDIQPCFSPWVRTPKPLTLDFLFDEDRQIFAPIDHTSLQQITLLGRDKDSRVGRFYFKTATVDQIQRV